MPGFFMRPALIKVAEAQLAGYAVIDTSGTVSKEIEAAFRHEVVRSLYAAIPLAAVSNIVVAMVLGFAQWHMVDHRVIVLWAGAVAVVTAIRVVVAYLYSKRDGESAHQRLWLWLFVVTTLAAALTWAAASLWLFVPGSAEHSFYVAIAVIVLAAGSVTTISIVPRLELAYLAITLLPLSIQLILNAADHQEHIGILLLLFTVAVMLAATAVSKTIRENIARRLETAPREEALRRNQELLHQTNTLTRVGGYEHDLVTGVTHFTDSYLRLYEVPPGESLSEKMAFALVEDDAKPALMAAMNKAIDHGEDFDIEVPFRTLLGNQRWMRTVGHAERINGRTVRIYGASHDVTHYKSMEDELRRYVFALENLHSITSEYGQDIAIQIGELIELGLLVFNLDIGIVSRIDGDIYTVEHIVGSEGVPAVGTEFDLGDTYCVHTLKANGPTSFHNVGESTIRTHPCYRKFGLEAYIGSPLVVDGKRYGTLNFSSPARRHKPFSNTEMSLISLFAQWVGSVLSRQHAADQLARSEERVRQILESAGEGIFGLDREGCITFINPAAARMFGYDGAELIGRPVDDLIGERVDNIETGVSHPLFVTLDDGKPRRSSGDYFCRKDRSRFPVEFTSTPIRRNGDVVGVVVTFMDITERQQLESMKTEFMSSVSHELRTPLTAIHGTLGLLVNGIAGKIDDQAQQLVSVAYRNSERLAVLINDLLDMGRISSGQLQFDMQVQPLMSLVEEAVDQNRPFAESYGVRFDVKALCGDAWVNVDRIRLMQVMTNLLSNAAKFSPRGSTVSIMVERLHDYFRVTVTDQGPGVPDKFADQAFERFAQADKSDDRTRGGAGLGLSISKSLIEMMHGRIGFQNEPVGGASFFFDLPEWGR
jgi:PAS domain S-box-containing protein